MKNFLTSLGTGILFLILFVAGAFFNEFLTAEKSFNANKSINFSRDIEVSKPIIPNLFVSEPNFVATEILANKTSLNSDEKAQISKLFSMIIDRVQKDGICVGGSYLVEPRISHKDESIVGQKLSAKLTCKFTKDKFLLYNELLNDIESILKNSDLVSVSMPLLVALADPKEIQKNEEELYDELLAKSLKLASHYSQTLGKNCSVSNLNLISLNPLPRAMQLNSAKQSSQIDLTLPIIKDEIQKASANVVYVCK
ncbi:hypothetical protein CHL_1789 [Campylobacter hyointestinalis subsp. lawsonii CCUG 27631]|uniref:hypothetical protein n=1 Tax=Campylobacter hyointestinalis TaxID=198 RepID=UPI0007C91925|nr:hypothetical protein [Campylobacter hyointestinalis]ANE35070.1 hypothetical protein CHL_1789 [Campylobacter hyointestinalis subsp. lawsonii CCUG 27631]